MSSEAFCRRVAPPTLCTAVGLFDSVAELVLLQVAHLKETLPTAGAFVAPLFGLQSYCEGPGPTLQHPLTNCLIWNQLGGPIRTVTPSASLQSRGLARAKRGVQPCGWVMKASWFGCQAGAAAGRRSCKCICCYRSVFGSLLFFLSGQLLQYFLLFCVSSFFYLNFRLQCCHLLRSVFLDNCFGNKIR